MQNIMLRQKREPILLVIGDILLLTISLELTLLIRYGANVPKGLTFQDHIVPFSILFAVWLGVFFVAGLYEKHTTILRRKLPPILIRATLINSVIAVLFFYFIPYFNVTPKLNLFLYLIVSSALVSFWRLYGVDFFSPRHKQTAILVGEGDEMQELFREVNENSRYDIRFAEVFDLRSFSESPSVDFLTTAVRERGASVVVVDLGSDRLQKFLPTLYSLIFSNIQFIEMHKIYEDVFDRIPLSSVRHNWFLENISLAPHITYDILKRLMDILISLPLLLIPVVSYPFVLIAIKIEDGGGVFTHQKRIGKNNGIVRLVKYRTMLFNDDGDWREKGKENKVTRVGAFLRKTRLDEFPQLWSVLTGDISLIGPRPEFPEPVKVYASQVPYYNIRHLIKPGLSGWAQVYGEHPHHGIDMEKTSNKLSYDLYYIKNRSIALDLKIALRTLQKLLSQSGV